MLRNEQHLENLHVDDYQFRGWHVVIGHRRNSG